MKLDYKRMKQVCLSPIESFESLGDVQHTQDGILVYRENPKAKILAVAHLDSVVNTNHFYHLSTGKDTMIVNAQLDDRLGVYTLLDILPQLGIQYDLLLTEGEEQGRSTAAHFESSKEYNWMFSFDRRGSDVVMYEYDSQELRKDLIKAKFRPDYGSFSDICFLDHLGIRGFNVGTGYHGEHNDNCYASIRELLGQVNRFKSFYDLFHSKKYPYEQRPLKSAIRRPFYDDLYCYLCEHKRGTNQVINDIFLCDDCMGHAAQCQKCFDIFMEDELFNGICFECETWIIKRPAKYHIPHSPKV